MCQQQKEHPRWVTPRLSTNVKYEGVCDHTPSPISQSRLWEGDYTVHQTIVSFQSHVRQLWVALFWYRFSFLPGTPRALDLQYTDMFTGILKYTVYTIGYWVVLGYSYSILTHWSRPSWFLPVPCAGCSKARKGSRWNHLHGPAQKVMVTWPHMTSQCNHQHHDNICCT